MTEMFRRLIRKRGCTLEGNSGSAISALACGDIRRQGHQSVWGPIPLVLSQTFTLCNGHYSQAIEPEVPTVLAQTFFLRIG